MASIKVKFRPSTASGREGSIYYQVIHGHIVRQVKTDYRIFDTEWDKRTSSVGKSSVSCPLKPSDSAPLKHSTMPP